MYMYIYCCRSIVYEKSLTLFRVHEPPFHAIIRNVTLSNQFDFPVVIYSAKLSLKALDHYSVSVHVHVCVWMCLCVYTCICYFCLYLLFPQIISFQSPYVIPPDSKWHSPIRLKFVPTSSDCLFNTSLKLSTNASFFNIPLQCYDGRLEVTDIIYMYWFNHLYLLLSCIFSLAWTSSGCPWVWLT